MDKRLDITKEKITEMYVGKDLTTYQISNNLGISRRSVSNLLKNYGISIKRHKRIYSGFYTQKLNEVQKELIFGSLLGDGCINKHHEGINSCRFVEQHSIKQLEYLKYKKSILQNFVSKDIRFIDNSKNNSYGNGISCCMQTVLHSEFVPFRDMFYPNGKKIVSYFKLTPFSLAIWYFDDGSIGKDYATSKSYKATLHTEDFDQNSIDNLQKMLFDSFGISSYISTSKQKYLVIRLNVTNTAKLMNIVSKIEIPNMSYKIKLSNNPVETCSEKSGASELKCSDANTFGSFVPTKDDGIVQSLRK